MEGHRCARWYLVTSSKRGSPRGGSELDPTDQLFFAEVPADWAVEHAQEAHERTLENGAALAVDDDTPRPLEIVVERLLPPPPFEVDANVDAEVRLAQRQLGITDRATVADLLAAEDALDRREDELEPVRRAVSRAVEAARNAAAAI